MKDDLDQYAIDFLPKKRGRPVADPDRGPMTVAQRVAAYRARKRKNGLLREIALPAKTWTRLNVIAERSGVTVTEILIDLISDCPLPRKKG